MENSNIQIQFVPIELCEFNEGQIEGVPSNPRTREDAKQKNLEKSIEELPEMTVARAALCFPYNGKYVVIGGNRRLEAQRALGRAEIPIIALPADTPVEKLRRIALLDNESTGKTDWDKIMTEWDTDELMGWGVELPEGWDASPNDFGETFQLNEGDRKPYQQMSFILSDQQVEFVKDCLREARNDNSFDKQETYGNANGNGNALYLILTQWAEQRR